MAEEYSMEKSRLVIVSNRLPFVLKKQNGEMKLIPGSGGLVTAMAPILRHRGGVWVGWPGEASNGEALKQLVEQAQEQEGFIYAAVFLTQEEIDGYYKGFSNEIIWPLFHDLQHLCHFVPNYWRMYQQVNSKFADVLVQNHAPDDFIWIHDYHLMLLASELRKRSITSRLSFFLHTPFPPLDIFIKLPWRFQVIHALLEYDLIGFQTIRDRRNFIQCVRTLLKEVVIENQGALHVCKQDKRETHIGAFPIGMDSKEFIRQASSKEVSEGAWYLHEHLPNQKIVLSLDRLDYTKGIVYRLEAIRTFLKQYPEMHKKFTFIQVVVPSRTGIPEYQALKVEVDRLVGEINSEFTQTGWVPIQYLFRSLNRLELLAFYRTSEVILITPIKDGMNLVAKEYVACNIEGNGVVILSEFSGVATQFYRDTILINPYDIEGVSEAIYTALNMPNEKSRFHMRRLKRLIHRYDVFWWVKTFLNAAFGKELVDFPSSKEYLPEPFLESELQSLKGHFR
jgi:trehalose 6-phosphate synthase/phosphatase